MPELRDYQVEDLSLLMRNPRTALLHDPACGKTPPVCVYLYWLWSRQNTRSVWVMPKSLMEKNQEELLEWTHFEPEDVVIVDGTPKKREKLYASDAKVFIMGPDMFGREWEKLLDYHPDIDCLAADEVHVYWSTATSQRTRSMFGAMRKINRFVAMTGTLINGRLNSAFPTLHVLYPAAFPSHNQFLNLYAVFDLWYGDIVGWKNHDMLKQAIESLTHRRTFTEIYGEEGKAVNVEMVSMSTKQFEAYKEMEESALLELEDEFLEAGNPGVHAIRCRQLMQSPEIFGVAEGELTGKDEQLKLHLEDHKNTGSPLLIYAAFQAEQERIAKLVDSYGLTVEIMNGNTSGTERGRIDGAFRNQEIQVLVCSPQVAGYGFNWSHVDHIIYTSLTYGDGDFLQSYRRAIRGERKHPLLITILKYRNSAVENRVFQIVRKKSADAHLVDKSRELFATS